METILDWLRTNVDVFGFLVACLIFAITIILVAKRVIKFLITLLLLLFALLTGFIIANQDVIKDWLQCKPQESNKEITEETTPPSNDDWIG